MALTTTEQGNKNKANYIFAKKMIPFWFGYNEARYGRKMCNDRGTFVLAIQDDTTLVEQMMVYGERALGAVISEQGYQLYRQGYQYALAETAELQKKEAQKYYASFDCYSIVHFEALIKAISTILYNADMTYISDSVIKLISWVQWFRYSLLSGKDKNILITPSALFFFSGIGGTGKGEILKGLMAAAKETKIAAGYVTTSGISGRFVMSEVKYLQLGVIAEALWVAQRNRDINIDVINNIIDQIDIDFEQKGKEIERIRPEMVLVGATNAKFLNRRFSLIPFNERTVDKTLNPPTPTQIKDAWIDLLAFVPDPNIIFYDVQTLNQKSPQVNAEIFLAIYDYFYKNGDALIAPVSVRTLIKHIVDKGKESVRQRQFILSAITQLINQKILRKLDNRALLLANVTLDNEEKFERIISGLSADNVTKETKIIDVVKKIIFDKYIIAAKAKFLSEIEKLKMDISVLDVIINRINDENEKEQKILQKINCENRISEYTKLVKFAENSQ